MVSVDEGSIRKRDCNMKRLNVLVTVCISLLGLSACVTQKRETTSFLDVLDPGGPSIQSVQAEKTPSGLRVAVFDGAGVQLGRCASYDGTLLPKACLSKAPNLDFKKSKELGAGKFRYYNSMTSFTVSAGGDVPAGSVETSIATSTHRIVMEWARFDTQEISNFTGTSGGALVSGADVGVALRVIFDVTVASANAEGRASFGFGNIATALALNEARVDVSYDVKGTTTDLLPPTGVSGISNVDGFIKVVGDFYTGVADFSKLWSDYVDGTSTGNFLVPEVVAYHVTGMPVATSSSSSYLASGYVYGIKSIATGDSCVEALSTQTSSVVDFRLGVSRAYTDILRVPGCNNKKPSAGQIDQAISLDVLKLNET